MTYLFYFLVACCGFWELQNAFFRKEEEEKTGSYDTGDIVYSLISLAGLMSSMWYWFVLIYCLSVLNWAFRVKSCSLIDRIDSFVCAVILFLIVILKFHYL